MRKRSILIVDDDKDLLQGISACLKANEYNTLTATSVSTAQTIIQSNLLDLVLLDLGLPDESGHAVLEFLEQIPQEERPAVIVLSARPEHMEEGKCLKLGAVRYFNKPFDVYDLLDAVHQAFPKPVAAVSP